MTEKEEILKLIQCHKALDPFNYKLAVDWAINLIRQGKETDNILMLASFSEPIEKYEVSPYLTAVLNELGIEELECDDAMIAKAHFLLSEILRNNSIRDYLYSLSQLCIEYGFDSRIMDFYLLHHGWSELEEIGVAKYRYATSIVIPCSLSSLSPSVKRAKLTCSSPFLRLIS